MRNALYVNVPDDKAVRRSPRTRRTAFSGETGNFSSSMHGQRSRRVQWRRFLLARGRHHFGLRDSVNPGDSEDDSPARPLLGFPMTS